MNAINSVFRWGMEVELSSGKFHLIIISFKCFLESTISGSDLDSLTQICHSCRNIILIIVVQYNFLNISWFVELVVPAEVDW